MNFKNFLKYLIIIVIIALISVSVVLSINVKRAKDMEKTAVLEQVPEDTVEDSKESHYETSIEESNVEDKNYYVSSLNNFKNYSFVCPDGWELLEEDSGSRVLIKSGGSLKNKSIESILIMAEPLSDASNSEKYEDVFNSYINIADSSGNALNETELLSEEVIYIDGTKTKIMGYRYSSLLCEDLDKNDLGEVDFITCIEKDECVYLIKYMGSNVGTEDAKTTLKNFIATFSFNEDVKAVKKDDENSSINILILGDDSAYDRAGGRVSGRTDIIMILHVNLETYEGTIITIPRDTWVSIPGHGDGKINGAHAVGGTALAVETIENFSGLDIDNYIITDFDGFKPLIDFLGGVTVEVTEDLADGFSGCYLKKGIHHLNGEQTLALCRNRHRSGDGTTQGGAYAREKESAKVIVALYEQQSSVEKILKFPAFINFLLNYTWTDLGFADILKLLPSLGRIDTQNIRIRTIPSWPQMVGNASAVVYDEEATMELFQEIKNQ
jgi:LCP family protein required for cell wall assembly